MTQLSHDTTVWFRLAVRGRHAQDGLMTNTPMIAADLGHTILSRAELSLAISEHQLALHYQPTVNLANGRVSGFEALIRWPHEKWGLLNAAAFVPLAEETGLIQALDNWVLWAAAEQLAVWQEDVLVTSDFRLAVNVSAVEMGDGELIERIREAVVTTGVDPTGLVVEVTETCKIEDVESAKRAAHGLHAMGVELALDDFGSRYGTFSLLNSLPFDILKIDREFTMGTDTEHGMAFLRALVDLSNSLGIRIIAEGIETIEQARRLRALGCHEGQGFLWAPALSLRDAESLLTTGRWPKSDGAA